MIFFSFHLEVAISFYFPPWDNNIEPSESNIRQWMDNLYARFQPLEQARWNEGNIDSMFYAGSQSFVNRFFSFAPTNNYQNYYFNLVQQPVNMLTGLQRQHRKSTVFQAFGGTDDQTADQYTKLIMNCYNRGAINEQFSKACELAAVSGMVLLQPYLDFKQEDQAQGSLKLKIWEYNSFMVDPFFREPDMSDAQYVWCQEYISKQEAEARFPGQIDKVRPMAASPQRYGNFYFLPENYNMNKNDLMVLSYIWYKWKKSKKRLYSKSKNQFFDYTGEDGYLEEMLFQIPDLEEVTVQVDCWKVAVVLNDQLMFQGENPLGFDGCPFIPVFWNYDPHINHPDLRVRSLIRPMRTPQFLFNYKVINNNDIAAATLNAGWKRKVGAVANEDNLKKTGQGYDIIINDGYELTDCEKIMPSAVPESDLALAQQMADLIFKVSGVDLENWSAQQDKQASTLTTMIKQAANLMVFQKFFDQWDYALRILGDRCLQIILHNWTPEKIALIINEEPSPFFYSKIYSTYHVMVEEADLTPTQQNLQAQNMMEINERFGREVFPPSFIIPKLNITGKAEIIKFLQDQEQQAGEMQQHSQMLEQTKFDAEIKELYARATAHIGRAREDHSRSESNLGLYEERLSMIEKNRTMSIKEKQEALTKLLETMERFGAKNTQVGERILRQQQYQLAFSEEREKQDVQMRTESNKFIERLMAGDVLQLQ